MTAPPLVLLWAQGGRAYLAAPVPERAVLPLPMLTSLALREWVIVTDDDAVSLCDHDFRVIGWAEMRGLVVEHDCSSCEGMP